MYDSVFSAKFLYRKMLEEPAFEVSIVVIPDIARGEENMFYQMQKTSKSLSSYPNVLQSYNVEQKIFMDFSDKFDMVCFDSPYDTMTHTFYTIGYLSKNTLTFHIPYGFMGNLKYDLSIFSSLEYSLLWRVYVENLSNKSLIEEYQATDIDNLCVIGFPKMDTLKDIIEQYSPQMQRPTRRKKIIIAPHHTVYSDFSLKLSNFVDFSEFFLELPLHYPQIDFIFRPHPLLFLALLRHKIYETLKGEDTQAFIDNYLSKIEKIPNMTYQEGGDYFETFATSDALIHDCGSFIAEYLYTDKPEAFILQSQEVISREFTALGTEVLKHCYLVSISQEILAFIDTVVIAGQDTKKQSRLDFANKAIRINYPQATDYCLNDIKRSLLGA